LPDRHLAANIGQYHFTIVISRTDRYAHVTRTLPAQTLSFAIDCSIVNQEFGFAMFTFIFNLQKVAVTTKLSHADPPRTIFLKGLFLVLWRQSGLTNSANKKEPIPRRLILW